MCIRDSNITMYVMRIFNEAKYLEPPLLFWSFVRYVSKHLPREVQITLMTREVADINELENILDIFQNIRDCEIGRRPNQSGTNSSSHFAPQRGSPQGHAYGKQENHSRDGGWNCTGCSGENYVGRNFCFRCRKPRPNQRSGNTSSHNNIQQRAGDDRGGPSVSYTHLDVYKRQG